MTIPGLGWSDGVITLAVHGVWLQDRDSDQYQNNGGGGDRSPPLSLFRSSVKGST